MLLECKTFDQLELCIREASCVPPGSSAQICDQVRYLSSYLKHSELAAKTILVESPYVDRHWLEEYAHYYATLLAPPKVKATRLHFFDESWTLDEFKQRLAASISNRDVRTINDHYLGFSVIRPLPDAPIGRTVLRTYGGDLGRCFAPARLQHRVHLAGLTLEVDGLPFQQQDQGVAACATTAIWSALTKTIRADGGRAPTPFAITKAATDHRVQARAFPAIAGLDLDQMATAIQELGYQPHVFKPAGKPDEFFLALKTYLRSGIPVVIRAKVRDGDLHALTLVGYREQPRGSSNADDIKIGNPERPRLRSGGIKRWYAHDDRLGPYARLDFSEGGNQLELLPSDDGFEHLQKPMSFWDAIVPLYPKLRLTAEELIEFGIALFPLVKFLLQSDEEGIHAEPSFMLGGEYLHCLHHRPLQEARAVELCTPLSLSRYVGVISWFLHGEWVLDAVYDTTDLRRGDVSRPPMLALIPCNITWVEKLEKVRSLRFGDTPLIG